MILFISRCNARALLLVFIIIIKAVRFLPVNSSVLFLLFYPNTKSRIMSKMPRTGSLLFLSLLSATDRLDLLRKSTILCSRAPTAIAARTHASPRASAADTEPATSSTRRLAGEDAAARHRAPKHAFPTGGRGGQAAGGHGCTIALLEVEVEVEEARAQAGTVACAWATGYRWCSDWKKVNCVLLHGTGCPAGSSRSFMRSQTRILQVLRT